MASTNRRGRRGAGLLEGMERRVLLSGGPELWFYVQTNLAVGENVTSTEALIDQAAAAGYSHMMLEDSKLNFDGILRPNAQNPAWDPRWGYYTNIKNVINYAAARGITVVPSTFELGRADDWVLNAVDQNLAEGMRVVGATFTVSADGKSLVLNPQNPATTNMGFESGKTGWSLDAGRASIDTTVSHSGTASLKIGAGTGRGFGIQTITLQANRQYDVSFWVKESNFSGDELVKIYDPAAGRFLESNEGDRVLAYNTKAGGWQKFDYVFNSGGTTSVQLRVGTWGNTAGTLWYDDVSLTETALVNVVRNTESPLTITRVSDGKVMTEGVDFNPVQEPYQAGVTGLEFSINSPPLVVTIPASGSSLHAGEQVRINFDGAQGVYGGQYAASMTDPGVLTYYHNNVVELQKSFANGTPFMLGGYDEIRSGNTSTGDAALGLTAGQLMAQSFQSSYNIVRAVDPTAPIYTWSDMFDPYHNAVNNFYLWRGDLTGSWLGLPKDVTVMNWNLGDLNQSLKFFAGLGNQQIIAGYYDVADGNAEAQLEVSEAVGAAGVRGLMYTTWSSDYSQLDAFAAGAKAAWAQYITPPTVTGVFVRGSGWTSGFLSSLASSGQGDAVLGYRIPVGSGAQIKSLPWGALSQVAITFSENVNVGQGALAIVGVNTSSYSVSKFTYDAGTKTAVWTLTGVMGVDAVQLDLAGSGANAVTDIAGNVLDGDWNNPATTGASGSNVYPSGNGVSGGDFVFNFNVVPGDMTQDGKVTGADYTVWADHYGMTGQSWTTGDLTGDGLVTGADYTLWADNYGKSAPAMPTGAAVVAGAAVVVGGESAIEPAVALPSAPRIGPVRSAEMHLTGREGTGVAVLATGGAVTSGVVTTAVVTTVAADAVLRVAPGPGDAAGQRAIVVGLPVAVEVVRGEVVDPGWNAVAGVSGYHAYGATGDDAQASAERVTMEGIDSVLEL